MKKICIIYGGPSSEHNVSINTTKAILDNIDLNKYELYLLYIDKKLNTSFNKYSSKYKFDLKTDSNFWFDIEKLEEFDLCFLGMHGEFGEDGTVQSILEVNNILYTGSDSYSSRLCMDKYRSSILVNSKLGISIPATVLTKISEIKEMDNLRYPLLLKPNKLGSSVGVYFVESERNLLKFLDKDLRVFKKQDEYLIQDPILDSLEISCGVLEKKDNTFIPLPPIEIHPKGSSFFDYKSKYQKDGALEITPPTSIPKSLSEKISNISKDIHRLLGCRLYSRSDFLIKDGKIYYLETNTLPGLTVTSLLPKECSVVNITYEKLIDFLIKNSF
jgi:D-alanine-D-alanine ligase